MDPARMHPPVTAGRGFVPSPFFSAPESTYRKDAAPDGGTTHHIHWVRTPGPVADRVVAWWESRN